MSKVLNYKLVLLGDSAVGKSCISNRFVNDNFYDFQEPTIGAAFSTKEFVFNEKKIKYEIWDTAGQERYRSLAPMYYRGARAAVIVFDITNILLEKNDRLVCLVNKKDVKQIEELFE